jgi:Uncharacterized protein conserved in bacteria (DUF2066)
VGGLGQRGMQAWHGKPAAIAAILALAALAPLAHAGGATSAVFTVANYPVEARAKDAVTAKATALADGQQAALRSLLRRIVPVTAYRRLKSMPPLKAADLIDGVSVRQERNSPTEYIATLDFAFQANAVRDALRRNGLPFVDTQAPQTVLVPIYRAKPDAVAESGAGVWFDAWRGLDLVHTLAPVKLEKLKPEIVPDTIKSLLAGTHGADRILASEYKSERVVLAIAEADAAGKKMTVTIAGTDAAGPFKLVRSYRIAAGDTAYTAELAAVVGLGVLEGRWKAAKAGAIGGVDITAEGGAGIQLIVEFATLAQWNDMRGRIVETDGALDVAIGSVSARTAEVVVRHPQGPEALAEAFARNGLTMSNFGGQWIVRATF